MKIKTIIFDLGNVLVNFDHSIAAKKLSRKSPYSIKEIYNLIFDSDIVSKYETGHIKTDAFYKRMKALLGFDLKIREFRKIWDEIFFPNPETEKIVRKLKKRFRLLLLSNINHSHYEHIRIRFPILGEFDRIILSYRVGARKPDLKIYEKAIREARCLPREIVYIDDRADLIEAAKKIGINSIRFKNCAQLKKELLKFGINSF
jgi:epoxide hydrolase-like predicted phosphatase